MAKLGSTQIYGNLYVDNNVVVLGTIDGSISHAVSADTATKLKTARTINGTSFDGSANITTANWGTARTITIGNTGKSVNGSGNVSWSLAEIGALPLTGGTVTGIIRKTGSYGAGFIVQNGTSRTMMYSSSTLGEHVFGGSNNSSDEPTDYIRVGNNRLQYKTNGTDYNIYHSGNKPTANDVGAVKRVILTGKCQITSYRKSVIALCELRGTNTSYNSYSNGKLIFHRDNGLSGSCFAEIAVEDQYGGDMVMNGSILASIPLGNIRLCTFKYNGKYYGGVEFFFSDAEFNVVEFLGSTNFDIFALDYADTRTGQPVLNQEVLDSLNFTDKVAKVGSLRFNDNYIYHKGYKPTASEVGALPLSGGTMTGPITTPNNAQGIKIGDDAVLCDRNIANHIVIEGSTPTSGGITFGSGKDTNIYRGGTNLLKTDDTFNAVGGFQWNGQSLDSRYSDKSLNKNSYTRITVNGDANTYYPVLLSLGGTSFPYAHINISRVYNWAAPDTWYTSNHRGGLTLSVRWTGDTNWGGNDKNYIVEEFNETYSTMVAGLALSTSGLIVWLRGGGALYQLDSEYGVSTSATITLGSFTASNNQVYEPRTNTNNVTEEIKKRWMTRGTSGVFDNNNRVYSASNKPAPTDIGALPLTGGTMTGSIASTLTTSTHIAGNKGNAIINSTANGSGYNMLMKMNSTNGVWTMGGWGSTFNLFYTTNSVVSAGTNSYNHRLVLLDESGNSSFPGTITGTLSGNASTATKLQTARTIFGKSFDGTSNVSGKAMVYGTYTSSLGSRYYNSALEIRENSLVASTQSDIGYAPTIGFHWSGRIAAMLAMSSSGEFQFIAQNGSSYSNVRANSFIGSLSGNASTATMLQTARTITIGNTGKSFNGSANVSWSLAEIGALPLTGGTVTGETIFNNYLSINAWPGYGSGKAQLWYNGTAKELVIQPTAVTNIRVNHNLVLHRGNNRPFYITGDNTTPNVDDMLSGIWEQVHSSATGTKPSGIHNGNSLIAFHSHSGNYGSQIWSNQNADNILWRNRNNGSWSAWREFLHSEGYVGSQSDTFISYPKDGRFRTNSNAYTGYLKITLPQSWTNTMMRFTVEVYNYATNSSVEFKVGGYNYAPNSSWINTFAYAITHKDSAYRNLNVRFGHDGSKCAIYIGEASTTWSYPQVTVKDITVGYSSYALDSWKSGWAVGFTTTLGTITSTISNTFSANGGVARTADALTTARTINGTSFNGTANITTANWGTARTITIGNTGKSVNGSGNVSWSISEIGAIAAVNANGYYGLALPDKSTANWIRTTQNGIIPYQSGGYSSLGTSSWPFSNAYINSIHGSLLGNASTATTLQTARTINGTSFNGSANITTSYWGTARTLTIGNTGKSVNGSGNVSWSLSEIGAASVNHTHNIISTQGDRPPETGRNAISGLRTYGYYANGGPTSYGEIISFGSGTGGHAEIAVSWSGSPLVHVRSLRDTTDNWTGWLRVLTANDLAQLNITDYIQLPSNGTSWINGSYGGGIRGSQQTTSSFHPMLRQTTAGSHRIVLGGLNNDFGFYLFDASRTANGIDGKFVFNVATKIIWTDLVMETSTIKPSSVQIYGTSCTFGYQSSSTDTYISNNNGNWFRLKNDPNQGMTWAGHQVAMVGWSTSAASGTKPKGYIWIQY